MKKINSIRFKNFKAFYGEESLQLDGKNLLVYGENGSGKSSIFWGLYTFLQSSSKDIPNITKYFVDFDEAVPNTHDSLKNIFSPNTDDAFIELETIDTATGTRTTDRIDAINPTTDIAKNNATIALANASSDFINYKLLHNFYNVTHKQDINLWQVFMRDIFPFFRKNENVGEKYFSTRIEELTRQVPMSSGGVKNLKIGSRPQVEYVAKIDDLNNDIQIFLNEIEQNANLFLKDHFFDGKEILKLALSYDVKIDYDSVKWQNKSKYSIKLDLVIWDDILKVFKKVKRPHSFLNEALLTRIAFAVRIGALQTRLQNRNYQILCLDDLLISLDMGNRDKVIQLILNVEKKQDLEFFDKFQKLIFTHDKAFYNLCKQRIKLAKGEDNWYFKEIYLDTDKSPQRPFIDNSTDYFEKAEKHLKAFDYPAAANALRQGLENLIFRFLPNNYRLTKERKGEELTIPKQFNDLLEALKSLHRIYGVDVSKINDLFVYKDNLLNPLSHDNILTAVYKEEIQKVLKLVPDLKILRTDILKEITKFPTIIKLIDTKNDTGEVIIYHIQLSENLLLHTLIDGSKHLSRNKIIALKYVYPDGKEVIRNKTHNSLFDYAKQVGHFLQTSYPTDASILSKLDLS